MASLVLSRFLCALVDFLLLFSYIAYSRRFNGFVSIPKHELLISFKAAPRLIVEGIPA